MAGQEYRRRLRCCYCWLLTSLVREHQTRKAEDHLPPGRPVREPQALGTELAGLAGQPADGVLARLSCLALAVEPRVRLLRGVFSFCGWSHNFRRRNGRLRR